MDARPLLAAGLAAAVLLPAQDAGAKSRLGAFANCDQLVSYARARAATAPNLVNAGRPVTARPTGGAEPVSAPAAANAPAPEPDFSTTNVQEQGIDEPDVVKTDGKVIYALS